MPQVILTLSALLFVVAGCGRQKDTVTPPLFAADYAKTFSQVRNCRLSVDHDLNHIRIVVDPTAKEPYNNRDNPFPVGSIVLKEEYDFSDPTCSGPIKQWTVMVKLHTGESPSALDWRWQRVDKNRNVVTEDEPRCYSCHKTCGVAPDGYAGTCSAPPRAAVPFSRVFRRYSVSNFPHGWQEN